MKKVVYTITARVWLYSGETASWHFITIPKKETLMIDAKYKNFKKGWGSLPVTVTIGKTVWETSIFPDGKSGTYLLPIKASVRRQEGVHDNDTVTFTLSIRV